MGATAIEEIITGTVNAYVKGFADGDLDAICDLYNDNATVEDPYGSPRKAGIKEIREFYKSALAAKPKIEIKHPPIIVNNFSATHLEAKVDFGGSTVIINLISVMSFSPDGKILSMIAHFDPASINA